MIVHDGLSSRRGHYYALIRQGSTGGWLKFDDEKITLIENPEKFLRDSRKAYILFYQKKWLYDDSSSLRTDSGSKDATRSVPVFKVPKVNPKRNDDSKTSQQQTRASRSSQRTL